MALDIPSYPDPRDPANPIENAYGFISEVTFSWFGNSELTLNINPNAAAWSAVPVGKVRVKEGETLVAPAYAKDGPYPPAIITPAKAFKTFQEMMQDPEFAQAFNVIGSKLQTWLLDHPRLAGATVI